VFNDNKACLLRRGRHGFEIQETLIEQCPGRAEGEMPCREGPFELPYVLHVNVWYLDLHISQGSVVIQLR